MRDKKLKLEGLKVSHTQSHTMGGVGEGDIQGEGQG